MTILHWTPVTDPEVWTGVQLADLTEQAPAPAKSLYDGSRH